MTASFSTATAWLALLCSSSWFASAQSISAQDNRWKLIWADEFDGSQLDYSKWGVEVNAFGGGNDELQMYTDRPKNVRVAGGHLILEAHADRPTILGTTRDYSSGKVRTKHRGDWTYGRFEVRARLPAGQGIWPAIWMLPTDEAYGPWAASGEIDIVEFKGQESNKVHGTLHFGGEWPHNESSTQFFKLPAGNFVDDFHVFTFDWEPKQMRWYVDEQLYETQDKWQTPGQPFPAPFDKAFHLLLNMAVGGRFAGVPNESTVFPQQLRIDYVRVYQQK